MVCAPVCFFSSLWLIFTLVAASISYFLCRHNSCMFSFRRKSSPSFFFPLALALSLLSTAVQTLNFSRKDSALLPFFVSESSCSHAIYRQNARLLEVRNFTQAYMKGCTYGRTYVRMILSETKFLGCIDNQIFLEGVYMTPGRLSRRREITPVPFHGSIFAYKIPPQREFTSLLYRGENFIISQRNHVNAKRPPVSG